MNRVTIAILVWHSYNIDMYCAEEPHGSSNSVRKGYETLNIKGLLCGTKITTKGDNLVNSWIDQARRI